MQSHQPTPVIQSIPIKSVIMIVTKLHAILQKVNLNSFHKHLPNLPDLSPLLNEHTPFYKDIQQTSEAAFTTLYQNDMASFMLTQNPESQPIHASNLLNNSPEQADIHNSKSAVAVEYDLKDSVFSLLESDENPEHSLGAPNVIKPPAKAVLEP